MNLNQVLRVLNSVTSARDAVPIRFPQSLSQRVMPSPEPLPSPLKAAHISRTPSYIQFAPRRAMASFENLVALANHQERLREARKIVWRQRGEPAVELEDLWECMEHAGRGGLSRLPFGPRSICCIYSTCRSCSNRFRATGMRESRASRYKNGESTKVSLAPFLKPLVDCGESYRYMRLSLIQHAIFGKDSFRFAAMLGE